VARVLARGEFYRHGLIRYGPVTVHNENLSLMGARAGKQEDALRALGEAAHGGGARPHDAIEAGCFGDRRKHGPVAKSGVDEPFSGRISEKHRGPTRLRREDALCALSEA